MGIFNIVYGRILLGSGIYRSNSGSVSMGIYGISFNLCTLLPKQITFLVTGVSFPAMAKMQSDLARLQESFMKALSHVCLIAIPIATGLFLVAEDLIPCVYGAKWEDASP